MNNKKNNNVDNAIYKFITMYYNEREICLRGRVRFPTGGKVREP